MIGRRGKQHHEHDPDVEGREPTSGTGADPADASSDARDPAGAQIESLRAQLDALRAERDDLEGRWKLEAAELRNFRRRAAESEVEARRQSLTGVLRSLVPLLDHMDMGIDQAHNAQSIDQIVGGVRSIRDEFARVLEGFGVVMIRPQVGDEPDPLRHQVLAFQPAPDVQPGRICAVFRPGYAIGDRVVRPAEVIVAGEPSQD